MPMVVRGPAHTEVGQARPTFAKIKAWHEKCDSARCVGVELLLLNTLGAMPTREARHHHIAHVAHLVDGFLEGAAPAMLAAGSTLRAYIDDKKDNGTVSGYIAEQRAQS